MTKSRTKPTLRPLVVMIVPLLGLFVFQNCAPSFEQQRGPQSVSFPSSQSSYGNVPSQGVTQLPASIRVHGKALTRQPGSGPIKAY